MATRVRTASGTLKSALHHTHPRPTLRAFGRSSVRPTSSSSSTSKPRQPTKVARSAPIGLLVGGSVLASAIAITQLTGSDDSQHHIEEQSQNAPIKDDRDPSLPRYRLSTIRQHDAHSPEPWVTSSDKVYNITSWVSAHPGGDIILRAAGKSIDPYWEIFSIHKQPHVREILDQYLIGYIDVADLGPDGRPKMEEVEDPFEGDPKRDERLVTLTAKPRNAETPTGEVAREFITERGVFYVRNHMWVPQVDERTADDTHVLTVELPDGEERRYTLRELKTKFPSHRVTAVLQCSGNRRSDMTRQVGHTNGLQWGVGAISNAEWEGVRLADVLADAGLKVASYPSLTQTSPPPSDPQIPDPNTLHIHFHGLEAYSASIPLPKALSPSEDVLLAYGMNGGPLPRDHGFPLRAIVPGTVAARSVKWLSKIRVADEEATSQWQRRDYKCFGPNEGANPDWERAVAIQEMPVTSAVTGVWVGSDVKRVPWMGEKRLLATEEKGEGKKNEGEVALQGYAYSGGGRAIARVDISLDGGNTWDQAELVDDCAGGKCKGSKAWAWTRWRYCGTLPSPPTTRTTSSASPSSSAPIQALEDGAEAQNGTEKKIGEKDACTELIVKATDTSYNSQPETHAGIYNVRGNLATAWHRLRVCPKCLQNGTCNSNKNIWSDGAVVYGCGFSREDEKKEER